MTAPLGCDAVAVPARFGPLVLPRLPRVGCVYADETHWWWIVPSDSDYALDWPAPARYTTGALVPDSPVPRASSTNLTASCRTPRRSRCTSRYAGSRGPHRPGPAPSARSPAGLGAGAGFLAGHRFPAPGRDCCERVSRGAPAYGSPGPGCPGHGQERGCEPRADFRHRAERGCRGGTRLPAGAGVAQGLRLEPRAVGRAVEASCPARRIGDPGTQRGCESRSPSTPTKHPGRVRRPLFRGAGNCATSPHRTAAKPRPKPTRHPSAPRGVRPRTPAPTLPRSPQNRPAPR